MTKTPPSLFRMCHQLAVVTGVLAGGGFWLDSLQAQYHNAPLQRYQPIPKLTSFEVGPRSHQNVIRVKFKEGQKIRVANGALMHLSSGLGPVNLEKTNPVIAALGARWRPLHDITPEELDWGRATAQNNLRCELPDLNLWFMVELPLPLPAANALAHISSSDLVETALPAPLPERSPTPDFMQNQGYLFDAAGRGGIDAVYCWNTFQTAGGDPAVNFGDVEYSFNRSHVELNSIAILQGGAAYNDPSRGFDENHGTATLGQVRANDDGFGTLGIAYHCPTYFSYAVDTNGVRNLNAAIVRLQQLGNGSVAMIEQQSSGGPHGWYIPVEWDEPVFQAIQQTVGTGVSIVEAAGNGNNVDTGENLDDPYFLKDPNFEGSGYYRFAPFLDNVVDANGVVIHPYQSGAIIVGGGVPSNHDKYGYSNYGRRVDMQGWGGGVFTTGYGNSRGYGYGYITEGQNYWYWDSFSGTSSATPIVAGACVLLRSADMKFKQGRILSPGKVKKKLRRTGTLQAGQYDPMVPVDGRNIGPLPNLYNALRYLLPNPPADTRGEDPGTYPNY